MVRSHICAAVCSEVGEIKIKNKSRTSEVGGEGGLGSIDG